VCILKQLRQPVETVNAEGLSMRFVPAGRLSVKKIFQHIWRFTEEFTGLITKMQFLRHNETCHHTILAGTSLFEKELVQAYHFPILFWEGCSQQV
jgi:hypothetical protein